MAINPGDWKLSIGRTERTQSVQYMPEFQPGTGSGCPDAWQNTIDMVAGKPMVIRVYPHFETPWPGGLNDVWGVLNVKRREDGAWVSGPPLSPVNESPVLPRSWAHTDRGSSDHSVNFFVPAKLCRGVVRFSVQLATYAESPAETHFYFSPLEEFDVPFLDIPRPKVRAVLICYRGPDYLGQPSDVPAPEVSDFGNQMNSALRMLPVSQWEYVGCTEHECTWDLRGIAGWYALSSELAMATMTSDDGADVVAGCLPEEIPPSGIGGIQWDRAAVFKLDWGPMVAAHEIGHVLGRYHAPCRATKHLDRDYPAYGLHESGSIGEYGFDVAAMTPLSPMEHRDFMSYCSPAWTSPYTYDHLKWAMITLGAKSALSTTMVESPPPPREHLYLIAELSRTTGPSIVSGYHLEGPLPPARTTRESRIWCDLLGEDDRVLASAECVLTDRLQDPRDGVLRVSTTIPWDAGARSVSFRRDERDWGRIPIDPEGPPPPRLRMTRDASRAHVRHLEWPTPADPLLIRHLVRYSNDGGRRWTTLAANVRGGSLTVNLDTLAGGDDCVFQVAAARGVRTTATESDHFAVETKPPRVYVLSPSDGQRVPERGNVLLLGGGYSPDAGLCDGDEVWWSSSLDGPLGEGNELLVSGLTRGRHDIRLEVPDGRSGRVSRSVAVVVEGGVTPSG
ncbi:hypothetical protein [Geodermatophilus arenarius]|uniref:Uncharacterized protein n=1 Tax=Geodermatophilus arenarius TaxID=1137990 RepID=A0ABV9LPA5_9ACTN